MKRKKKNQHREELQGKQPAIYLEILAEHVAMKYIGKLRGRNEERAGSAGHKREREEEGREEDR